MWKQRGTARIGSARLHLLDISLDFQKLYHENGLPAGSGVQMLNDVELVEHDLGLGLVHVGLVDWT